jgi:hypothetical protein
VTRALTLALLLATVAAPAQAETYRVDLIVFLDKSGGGESGRRVVAPELGGAIDPASTGALAAAGITLLPEADFALTSEWQHLRNAKRYQPLLKLAWTQKDPPQERGPALRVRYGQSFEVGSTDGIGAVAVSPVEGRIALLVGHYLHLDTDLVYTMPTGGGFASYRLRENRKMKRDELHYLDSPRLGVLARVTKASGEK